MSYFIKKIFQILYRVICKIVDFLIPFLFKVFLFFRIQSRILDILTRLRSHVHFNENYKFLISKLLKKKLIALDVGAQGGFFNTGLFHSRYNNYFSPILVEPIAAEAEKIKNNNYRVISKGLWSKNALKYYIF